MTGIPILERNRKYIIVINNLVDLFGGSDQPGDVCALRVFEVLDFARGVGC